MLWPYFTFLDILYKTELFKSNRIPSIMICFFLDRRRSVQNQKMFDPISRKIHLVHSIVQQLYSFDNTCTNSTNKNFPTKTWHCFFKQNLSKISMYLFIIGNITYFQIEAVNFELRVCSKLCFVVMGGFWCKVL